MSRSRVNSLNYEYNLRSVITSLRVLLQPRNPFPQLGLRPHNPLPLSTLSYPHPARPITSHSLPLSTLSLIFIKIKYFNQKAYRGVKRSVKTLSSPSSAYNLEVPPAFHGIASLHGLAYNLTLVLPCFVHFSKL